MWISQVPMQNKFLQLNLINEKTVPDIMWEYWKKTFKEAAEGHLGRLTKKIKKLCISIQAVDLMDRRITMKPLRHTSDRNADTYKLVTSRIHWQLILDKEL